MHIAHFCETSVEGHYFKNISEGLIKKGIKVSLIELGLNKPPLWLKEVPQVNYFNLDCDKRWKYPFAIFRLAKLLQNEKIDILQSHLFYAGLISVFAKYFNRKTIIILTRHYTSIVRDLGTKVHIFLDRFMYEKADCVVAVSEATKKYMIEVDKISKDHIKVIYLGFDFEKLNANSLERKSLRKEFKFEDDDFVIGYVANFAPRKGHLQLVTAFEEIIKKIPKAKLFLVGKGELQEVNEKVKEINLEDKICFAGWRQDIASCMSAMDLFIQPSLSEAFSQVLIESMGIGLPIIATDVGGASEVITNGENGILIEPNNVESIVKNTIDLFYNNDFRPKMALAGQKSVRERFTVEKMVSKQIDLYQELLEK